MIAKNLNSNFNYFNFEKAVINAKLSQKIDEKKVVKKLPEGNKGIKVENTNKIPESRYTFLFFK